jgi:hypothetical protein
MSKCIARTSKLDNDVTIEKLCGRKVTNEKGKILNPNSL